MAPDVAPSLPSLNDMSWLPTTTDAGHPRGHAQPPQDTASDACTDATSRAVALALVPKRSLPPQGSPGARAAHHPLGRGYFKRPPAAIGTVQTLRQQRRRPAASERQV